ncbi:MAG: PstS family phosphate ABC transporter substrate-binding protein [Oligoflexia bacterium]|nr:PstS family phosphate ABC transporter substrate-binding protein [Oligoflexia bacterium]
MKLMLIGVLLFSLKAFAQSIIKVDGSSTVFPITEAVSEEFMKEKKNSVRITVGISGTGGGFKKFCRGETDVQNASRPIMKEEMKRCAEAGIKYYEIPVAYDAMTIAVSPQNNWVKDITVDDLKKMWEPSAQGKITRWNQVRNNWPDAPLKLFGAGSDSGTFDYFTEAIVGKAKSSRGDYTASEDDNTLVLGISQDKNALGYVPYAYYEKNKTRLKALAINGGAKAPKRGSILPSAKSVEDGTYFPLSRPIFIYISAKSTEKLEIKDFVKFYLKNGPKLIKEVDYVPLPARAYAQAEKNFNSQKIGTVFKGEPQVGIKIDKLLKMEAAH